MLGGIEEDFLQKVKKSKVLFCFVLIEKAKVFSKTLQAVVAYPGHNLTVTTV